ncbi:MAG: nucleotidyltransferase domain-containing protein [Candidatus Altiarchaeota archaeon]
MYQDFNRYKILRVFFRSPSRVFQLRELVRYTRVSLPSTRNHVRSLEKKGFLEKVKHGVYPGYKLIDSEKTRIYKRNDLLAQIEDTGFIQKLEEKCRPTCIVLYGSAVEGRDDERGDIDIFVQSEKVKIEIGRYEKEFNRKVNLLFESDMRKLTPEFINNLANGIVLKGFLKVKQ